MTEYDLYFLIFIAIVSVLILVVSIPRTRKFAEELVSRSNKKKLTASKVLSLPMPTDSQWLRFADHLLNVHSWYKHLPLIEGGEFVVILSPDAGKGYPSEYPSLPNGNTVKGYRTAFGHLDYLSRGDRDEPFSHDALHTPELDTEIFNACSFVVYPFVSQGIYWSVHEDAIALIRNGLEHPYSEAILAAYDAESQKDECWQGLSRDDKELVLAIMKSDKICRKSIPKHIKRYLELENNARMLYVELCVPERKRIRNCVTKVRRWLEQNQGSG